MSDSSSSAWKVGSTFVFPLNDGRYSACRILQQDDGNTLVAASAWIGETSPSLDEPSLRTILHLTHHSWKNIPNMCWVDDAVPEDFECLGVLPVTTEESQLTCHSYGSWESVSMQPLRQWRWDHDREAMLEEEQAQQEKRKKQAILDEQARQQRLANLTLQDMHGQTYFSSWESFVEEEPLRASREVIQSTIESLMTIDDDPDETKRIAVLQRCIESFNALDMTYEFIMTIEREDICEVFYEITHACDLGHQDELADEWRDW